MLFDVSGYMDVKRRSPQTYQLNVSLTKRRGFALPSVFSYFANGNGLCACILSHTICCLMFTIPYFLCMLWSLLDHSNKTHYEPQNCVERYVFYRTSALLSDLQFDMLWGCITCQIRLCFLLFDNKRHRQKEKTSYFDMLIDFCVLNGLNVKMILIKLV